MHIMKFRKVGNLNDLNKYLNVRFYVRVSRPIHNHKSHFFILYNCRDAGRASSRRSDSTSFRFRWRFHLQKYCPNFYQKYTKLRSLFTVFMLSFTPTFTSPFSPFVLTIKWAICVEKSLVLSLAKFSTIFQEVLHKLLKSAPKTEELENKLGAIKW